VDDEEIIRCVHEAVGGVRNRAKLETLGGKQGLIVCRVALPGAGSFIFKAVKESCRRELTLTAALAALGTPSLPKVIEYREDAARFLYWIIMEDAGPCRLADSPTVENYIAAAEALANLQMKFIESPEGRRELNVLSIGPSEWDNIALSAIDMVEKPGSLSVAAKRRGLLDSLWRTTDVARDTVSLPLTLVHGDLHAGNIALRGRADVVLLDWGSAYIGAAFLGLAELLWPAARHLRNQSDLGRIRKAYFTVWSAQLGKPGRLEQPFAACQVLAHLSLLHESLRKPESYDDFAVAAAVSRYLDAVRKWERFAG
jgi:hypothetical protein